MDLDIWGALNNLAREIGNHGCLNPTITSARGNHMANSPHECCKSVCRSNSQHAVVVIFLFRCELSHPKIKSCLK